MGWRIGLLTLLVFVVPESLLAEPVCVSAEKASLRKGPGSQFPVTWTVGRFMPLQRISQKSSWSQVEDLDGVRHWINSSSLTTRFHCVVVRAKSAALRQGPSSKDPSAEIAFADRYTPFKKLDRDGGWLVVQDNFKGKFWVHETNLWFPIIKSKIVF